MYAPVVASKGVLSRPGQVGRQAGVAILCLATTVSRVYCSSISLGDEGRTGTGKHRERWEAGRERERQGEREVEGEEEKEY